MLQSCFARRRANSMWLKALHPCISTETPNFPHAFRRFTSCSPIEEFLRKDNEYVPANVSTLPRTARASTAPLRVRKLAKSSCLLSHRTVPNEAGNLRAAKLPIGRGRFHGRFVDVSPPTGKWNPHKDNGQYGPGLINMLMTPGDTLPPSSSYAIALLQRTLIL